MPAAARPVLLALAAALPAQLPCGDVSAVDAVVQGAVASLGLRGASLRIDAPAGVLFEQTYGSYGLARVVPIASASKWLAAAVLMSCVDSGHLRLDDPVARWIPSFDRPDKRTITLRQCFLHASGLPGESAILGDDTITLRQAADQIGLLPLTYPPGTAFLYGGVSMHVAGAACEVATGLAWEALFAQRVAAPLGMTATDFAAFGATANPRIAGGARSSLRDYARFVAMLRDGGTAGSTRVLSAAGLAEMFTEQTSHLPVISTPHPDNAPYGIGTWVERRDAAGRGTVMMGAGAFGFTGWVDLERDASGTFLVLDRAPAVHPFVERMKDAVRAALPPAGCACVGRSTPACSGAIVLNGDRLPRSGEPAFALTVAAAPPRAAGAVAFAADAAETGFPFAGVTVHLLLAPPPVLAAIASDAAGSARIPLPVLAEPDLGLGAQTFWLGTASCGGIGTLAASQALRLRIAAP